MTTISEEIAAYDAMRERLERDHFGEWVVIHAQQLVSTHASFDEAAEDAVRRFGRGPYLIRQVGAPQPSLPASALYQPVP